MTSPSTTTSAVSTVPTPNSSSSATNPAFEGASSGLLRDEDAATAAAAIEPGSAAVIVLYENRWAAPLLEAVHRNGGIVLESQRIPIEALLGALDAAEGGA